MIDEKLTLCLIWMCILVLVLFFRFSIVHRTALRRYRLHSVARQCTAIDRKIRVGVAVTKKDGWAGQASRDGFAATVYAAALRGIDFDFHVVHENAARRRSKERRWVS
jgi:hypothetical protein